MLIVFVNCRDAINRVSTIYKYNYIVVSETTQQLNLATNIQDLRANTLKNIKTHRHLGINELIE